MTARQSAVLDIIRDGGAQGVTTSEIWFHLNVPEPSIRRTIQELIRLGHNISYALDGRYLWRDGVK